MATLKLIPSGPGYSCEWNGQHADCPACPNHWECVEQLLYWITENRSSGTYRDLYVLSPENGGQLPEKGDVNSIKVYAKLSRIDVDDIFVSIRTHDKNYDINVNFPVQSGELWCSYQWDKNPYTGDYWTWEEIENLQAGVAIKKNITTLEDCLQVYVVLDYTPGPLIKVRHIPSLGITNPMIKHGDVIFGVADGKPERLRPGDAGKVFTTQGEDADPVWGAPPVPKGYAIYDDIYKADNRVKYVKSGVYVKAKEFTLPADFPSGLVRIYFEMSNRNCTGVTYGRIYKNDVGYGTERSLTGDYYQSYVEDLEFTGGDKIQLWVRQTTVCTMGCKYFRILGLPVVKKYDITITG